jgi:hypothetical protein
MCNAGEMHVKFLYTKCDDGPKGLKHAAYMATDSCGMATGSCDMATGSCDKATGSCDMATGSCIMAIDSCVKGCLTVQLSDAQCGDLHSVGPINDTNRCCTEQYTVFL